MALRGHMAVATRVVPAPQSVPVAVSKIFWCAIAPRHEVAPILCGQIDAIGLVVGCKNYPDAIDDAVLPQVLLVHAQHVRRGSGVRLHVVVELIAVDVPQVARLVNTQYDSLDKAVEAPKNLLWGDLLKIPGTNRALHWFERRVLAGALLVAADHECVVDLILRALHPMREPVDDMVGVVTEYLADVVEPRA